MGQRLPPSSRFDRFTQMSRTLLAYRWVRVSLTTIAVLVGFTILSIPYHASIRHLATQPFESTNSIYNRTLGFQKVFAIGFTSRSDKRDAMSLASFFSEFDITWSEAVSAEEVPAKAVPEVFHQFEMPPTTIGCWRAHMNVMQKMVNENIQTALIFEDDNDWDFNIKAQLVEVAKGLTELQRDDPQARGTGSSYGSSWDMLWLGHCYAAPQPTDPDGNAVQKMYMLRNDTTTPPVFHRAGWWGSAHVLPELLSNDTRIIFRTRASMCMWGYAVTIDAARKILTAMSIDGEVEGAQVDVALSHLAGKDYLRSYSTWPPLFGSHHFAGSASPNTDIWDASDRQDIAETVNVVYSTILNMRRFVEGAEDALSQWPNETVPSRSIHEPYGNFMTGELQEIDLNALPSVNVAGLTYQGFLDAATYHQLVANISRVALGGAQPSDEEGVADLTSRASFR